MTEKDNVVVGCSSSSSSSSYCGKKVSQICIPQHFCNDPVYQLTKWEWVLSYMKWEEKGETLETKESIVPPFMFHPYLEDQKQDIDHQENQGCTMT